MNGASLSDDQKHTLEEVLKGFDSVELFFLRVALRRCQAAKTNGARTRALNAFVQNVNDHRNSLIVQVEVVA